MVEQQVQTPAALGFHMPAEWHPHHSTWLSWPKDPETWPDRVTQVEHIYLQMIAALTPHEIANLLVNDVIRRLGSAVPIRPGAVNWMTAGKGIVHSERTDAPRLGQGPAAK